MNTPNKRPVVATQKPVQTQNKPAPKWGVKLLRDKTAEALRAGAQPPSQTLGNALAIAASDHLDLERLTAASVTLPDAARRVVAQALEKAKFPGVKWEDVIEPLLISVWKDKKREAAPMHDKARPQSGKPAQKAGNGANRGSAPNASKPKAVTGKPAAKGGKSKGQAKPAAKPAVPEITVKRAARVIVKPA